MQSKETESVETSQSAIRISDGGNAIKQMAASTIGWGVVVRG
jgi:hypothetical protein